MTLEIINNHIKAALDHLLTVQEIANRPYIIGKVVDIPTIREYTHRAVIRLLEANAMAEEEIKT